MSSWHYPALLLFFIFILLNIEHLGSVLPTCCWPRAHRAGLRQSLEQAAAMRGCRHVRVVYVFVALKRLPNFLVMKGNSSCYFLQKPAFRSVSRHFQHRFPSIRKSVSETQCFFLGAATSNGLFVERVHGSWPVPPASPTSHSMHAVILQGGDFISCCRWAAEVPGVTVHIKVAKLGFALRTGVNCQSGIAPLLSCFVAKILKGLGAKFLFCSDFTRPGSLRASLCFVVSGSLNYVGFFFPSYSLRK